MLLGVLEEFIEEDKVGDGNKEVSENKKDDVCEEEVCEEGC
jgi:hypothetical protein